MLSERKHFKKLVVPGFPWDYLLGFLSKMVNSLGNQPCQRASSLRVATGGVASWSSDHPAPPLARQQELLLEWASFCLVFIPQITSEEAKILGSN